jgi:hypothetical protein
MTAEVAFSKGNMPTWVRKNATRVDKYGSYLIEGLSEGIRDFGLGRVDEFVIEAREGIPSRNRA